MQRGRGRGGVVKSSLEPQHYSMDMTNRILVYKIQAKVQLLTLKAFTYWRFCSWSMLQGHFARVSTYKGALEEGAQDFAPKYLTCLISERV